MDLSPFDNYIYTGPLYIGGQGTSAQPYIYSTSTIYTSVLASDATGTTITDGYDYTTSTTAENLLETNTTTNALYSASGIDIMDYACFSNVDSESCTDE